MSRFCLAAGFAMAFGLSVPAFADEGLTPLATNGTWMAVAHQDSMVDQPDVCVAVETGSRFALRAQDSGVEIRLSNDSWSLPAGITGKIEVKVGSINNAFDIDSNTATMVAAPIDQDAIVPLLDAIAKESSMLVTAGKAKPVTVTLVGSSTVLNAFRTCANIAGSAAGGGTNPFQ